MTLSVAPRAPSPWVRPDGQPVQPFYQYIITLTSTVNGLTTNQTGAGSVAKPTGGSVVDVQARAAIDAIINALAGS